MAINFSNPFASSGETSLAETNLSRELIERLADLGYPSVESLYSAAYQSPESFRNLFSNYAETMSELRSFLSNETRSSLEEVPERHSLGAKLR